MKAWKTKVDLFEREGKRVIKISGDVDIRSNYGYYIDIDTGEEIKGYGYCELKKIAELEVYHTVTRVTPFKGKKANVQNNSNYSH